MYSVNVPVPPAVQRLAGELAPSLAAFDSVRDEFSLVAKRLESADPAVEKRVRRELRDAPAFEARVARVGTFTEPTGGPGPVVYLDVESPGLRAVHERLASVVDPVGGVEGTDYTPHVTLARGGGEDAAERLDGRSVGPVTWTVTELALYDARHGERWGRVPLG
ncbi:MAG: 2'-5' RNA ligase family protein [Halobacteriaceae archaeon]